MSYCRFSNSDAYVFHHYGGYITCMGCRIIPLRKTLRHVNTDPKFYKRSDVVSHLKRHVEAGHVISDCAFSRLKDEIENIGDFISLRVRNRRAPIKRRKIFKKRIKPISITRKNKLKHLSKLLDLGSFS